MRYLFLCCLFFTITNFTHAQQNSKDSKKISFSLADFADAAHHWYDIADKEMMIMPRPGHPRYQPTDITAIADNILLYQKENGGWPKNYDVQAILTQAQKDTLLQAQNILNTTFDNGTTYPQIVYLAKVYTATGTEKYKAAAIKGLNFILSAQYANGGWPQYYPLENNYSRCITYNDDAMCGIMLLLKDVADNKNDYSFIEKKLRLKLVRSYENGLGCILKTQINDDGTPTAWCQQYNEVSLQPAWARKFEPPSICNGESVQIVLLLMSIKDPSPAIINAVQNAVAWFKISEIKNTKIETFAAPEMDTPFRISKTDKRVIIDSMATPIWTRYYELKTHRPFFCNRDSKPVYTFAEVERERRDGYGWYTYEPQKVLNKYPGWQKKFAAARNVLK